MVVRADTTPRAPVSTGDFSLVLSNAQSHATQRTTSLLVGCGKRKTRAIERERGSRVQTTSRTPFATFDFLRFHTVAD